MDLLFKTPREIALEHEVNQLRRQMAEILMGDLEYDPFGVPVPNRKHVGDTRSPEEVRLKAENDLLGRRLALAEANMITRNSNSVWFNPLVQDVAEGNTQLVLRVEAGWEKDFGGYHIYGRERRPNGLRLGYYLSNNAMLQSHDRTTILAHTMRTVCEQLAKEKPE